MNAKLHPVLPVETAKLAMSGTGLLVPFVMHRACYAQGPQQRVVPHATMVMPFNLTAAVMFVGLDSFTMAQISLVLHVLPAVWTVLLATVLLVAYAMLTCS